jgi:D-alanine-D-alanine ligase
MKKIGLFFGGMSNEHEVSIASAKNIIQNINTTKYQLILLYRALNGSFYKLDDIAEINPLSEDKKIPFEGIKSHIDIALPMTHGKYGEDGVLQ